MVRIDHLSSTNTFPSWVGLVYVAVLLLNLKRKATGMADGDLRDQIASIESDIELPKP